MEVVDGWIGVALVQQFKVEYYLILIYGGCIKCDRTGRHKMNGEAPTVFKYIAFNEKSEAVLSHGMTAAEALSTADAQAPDAPIYVVKAGSQGWTIWSRKLSLIDAKAILDGTAKPNCRFQSF